MLSLKNMFYAATATSLLLSLNSCAPKNPAQAITGDAAEKVYIAPGKHDEFYNIVSGGFSGQVSVYGLPSGRLFRQIPVFSQNPESGWGYSEETKPMLNTSHGFAPWDDSHHIALSTTNGEHDGRWAFINANNIEEKVLIWQTIIHVAFLFSALAIAATDRLLSGSSAHKH